MENSFKSKIHGIALVFLILQVLGACNSISQKDKNQKLTDRVIFLGFDGFSVHGYRTAKHPHLDGLLADGVLSLQTRTVMPSVTLPNWTSHMTGSGPEQHGVGGNSWTLETKVLPPVAADSDGYYPSIFKVLKDSVPNLKTAYYYNWGNLINPINQKYLDEVSYQANDEYIENYQKALDFATTHKNDPTLIFLYTVHTDHAGHNFGWTSPEYIASIEEADVSLGKLLQGLKSENLYEDTHFILITDHGGNGKGHGGMTPIEMNVPWAVTGPGIQNGIRMEEPNNNTNTSSVVLRLFGISSQPKAWVGEVPESIFEKDSLDR